MKTVILLPKEDIVQIRFPKEDVLNNPIEVKSRENDLERARTLGNLEHIKVKISFMDFNMNQYEVETTIWALTDESVCLKGHLFLPKRAVLSLRY